MFPPTIPAEGSGESANDSSCEDEVIPIKHKPVQVRHSLLDKLDEVTSDPPKREDIMVGDHMLGQVTKIKIVM